MTTTLTIIFKTEPDPSTLATILGVSKIDNTYIDHTMVTTKEEGE